MEPRSVPGFPFTLSSRAKRSERGTYLTEPRYSFHGAQRSSSLAAFGPARDDKSFLFLDADVERCLPGLDRFVPEGSFEGDGGQAEVPGAGQGALPERDVAR